VNVSELMQAMCDAGAPMPAIIIAVRALEEKQAEIDARRSNDRERKRRQRHGNVTGQSQDTDGTVTANPSLDKEKSPRPPKEINPNPESISRARKDDPFSICARDILSGHWRDFCANRKSKRLARTNTAYAGILRDLAKFADAEWPPGRILQFAAERGWGAIFDPRKSFNGSNHVRSQGFQRSEPDGLGRTARAAIEVFGPPDDAVAH